MGSVQNFFTSRDNNTDPATYVGQLDRLWYNPTTNSIFVSNGSTPGGVPVALATNANIVANIITVNTVTSSSGNIAVTGNLVITGNISPASNVKVGGIKAGPGANISNDGTLTIDTSGLPLSFGDFTANNNILTLVNVNQNMILATQGNAEVQLVGNIGFYKTDGFPPNTANRYFRATDDGQVQFLVSNTDPLLGAVEIVGSTTGNVIAPGITGTMLHVTGQLNTVNRLYFDGNGDYVSIIGRRWNGDVSTPTQVLAGQDVLRINATAATDAGVSNVAFAQIHLSALENQTTTAQGSEISLIVTPVGQSAANRVEVANVTVANGVTATRFNTSGNISATGNITTANTFVGNVSGLLTRRVRNAGTIADGGTLTLDFAADDLVYCVWNNGMTIAGSNYTAGRVVKVMAQKGAGSGTDSITFNGFTASHISTGSTSASYGADVTAIIEFISTTAVVGGVYVKV